MKNFKWPFTYWDEFYPNAKNLRQDFEEIFSTPREAEPRRFAFDPWYVDGQFNHLKTPAGSFFSEDNVQDFFEYLVDWGRVNLGCQMISPPWLSMYTKGHYQNWHADNPQGPFAFVYTLTPQWKAEWGGSTLIMKPEILSYWSQFDFQFGLEKDDVYSSVTPKWNRLLVFDPRLPHRVEEVEQILDPMKARLVIHGWFVEPRPTFEGDLAEHDLKVFFEDFVYEALEKNEETAELRGYVCFKLNIAPTGEVEKVETMVSTLISSRGDKKEPDRWSKEFGRTLSAFRFKSAKGASLITLPFVFS